MILGSPYERLVAVNGKPLPLNSRHRGKRARNDLGRTSEGISAAAAGANCEIRKRARKRSPADGAITKALDFKLVEEKKLGPYEVYVLKATPRPGYEPPNISPRC